MTLSLCHLALVSRLGSNHCLLHHPMMAPMYSLCVSQTTTFCLARNGCHPGHGSENRSSQLQLQLAWLPVATLLRHSVTTHSRYLLFSNKQGPVSHASGKLVVGNHQQCSTSDVKHFGNDSNATVPLKASKLQLGVEEGAFDTKAPSVPLTQRQEGWHSVLRKCQPWVKFAAANRTMWHC